MKYFLLADDHVVVRAGIKQLLLHSFSPCVIMEASNGQQTLDLLAERNFDLLMLDIQMPQTEPLILMHEITRRYPSLKVLMFSMSPENIHAKRFIRAGAKGYISKDAPLEEIIKAVTLVLDNRRYISDSLAELLANETFEHKSENPFNNLSAREFEIAILLLNGQTISSISSTINIQISTVGTHKARMFKKLGVNNILELKELATRYNV